MKRLIPFVLFLITLIALTGCRAPLAVIDLDAELDQFIHGCIMERNNGHYHEEDNGYANESHEVLGTEASGNQITIYAWILYRQWKEENGNVEDVSGGDIPTAITVEARSDGTYKLIEYWEPRDGSYYQKDLKAKFPRKIRVALGVAAESKNRFNATQQDAEMYFWGDDLQDSFAAEVFPDVSAAVDGNDN